MNIEKDNNGENIWCIASELYEPDHTMCKHCSLSKQSALELNEELCKQEGIIMCNFCQEKFCNKHNSSHILFEETDYVKYKLCDNCNQSKKSLVKIVFDVHGLGYTPQVESMGDVAYPFSILAETIANMRYPFAMESDTFNTTVTEDEGKASIDETIDFAKEGLSKLNNLFDHDGEIKLDGTLPKDDEEDYISSTNEEADDETANFDESGDEDIVEHGDDCIICKFIIDCELIIELLSILSMKICEKTKSS